MNGFIIICESLRYDNAIITLSTSGMKYEFVTVIRPDLVWYDDNEKWLKQLVSSNGAEQKFFLEEMTEKKGLTMLAVNRLPGIDQTFHCWVI